VCHDFNTNFSRHPQWRRHATATMSEQLRNALRRAILRLLDPLTRLMLDVGIGAGEFHRLAKESYVRSAQKMLGGTRPNYSHIAVSTGLTRSEVTQILNLQAAAGEPDTYVPAIEGQIGVARAERVLRGWWQGESFQEHAGKPAILPLKGRHKSFEELVSLYAGGLKAKSVLQELLRLHAVRLLPGDRVEVISETITTVKWDADGIQEVGERVRDLLETLSYNLKNPMRPRFVRFVVDRSIDPKYLPLLRRQFTDYADNLAGTLQDSLSHSPQKLFPTKKPQDAVRLGLGFYLFEEPSIVEPKKAKRRSTKGT
jgi:hypothetical protein